VATTAVGAVLTFEPNKTFSKKHLIADLMTEDGPRP
jgi:hypothetical protein